MFLLQQLSRQLKVNRNFLVNLTSWLVALHGGFIMASTLLSELTVHHSLRNVNFVVDLPLLIGLSLLYLSLVLRRRKTNAWILAMVIYGVLVGLNVANYVNLNGIHDLLGLFITRTIVLPIVILGLLFYFRDQYVVRSDSQGFRLALRFSALILLAAFIYGTAGFVVLDKTDFHREISIPAAMHYTVDQFNLTIAKPVRPDTARAHLFVDSLSLTSTVAIVYAVLALFQPLRSYFSGHQSEREHMLRLLAQHKAPSEDFFKLWPHDKQYFFSRSGNAGLAFKVHRGMALCLGDPVGAAESITSLLKAFDSFCFGNGWQPVLVHVEGKHSDRYEKLGFEMQLLGQEAIVDLEHFDAQVRGNKYFRQINNRFTKQDYSCESLKPPHHDALLRRLRAISDEWLSQGSRVERGYVMGYFSEEYLQQCNLLVLRDAAGTIQAFLNQVPAEFDPEEITYDLMRQANDSPGNSNDFLLLNFIAHARDRGYKRLNMGLSPLVGLDEAKAESLVGAVLRFAYINGDRFYSFSGLHRFKNKYEPVWSDRYVAYRGGVRGFSLAMGALLRAMCVKTD